VRLSRSDFDFALPTDLIAQHPAPERSGARLLDGSGAAPVDRQMRDWPALLQPGDLLVFNDTRVIKARLLGHKASGGKVEALVERLLAAPGEVWAHVRASKTPKPGDVLGFGEACTARVLGRVGPEGSLFHLQFEQGDVLALLDAHGHVPLPPYITHADNAEDAARYQSIFAQHPGAVAAPTASLHFDEALLAAALARGVAQTRVTLHVGAGTFQPVREDDLARHQMHSEWFRVGADAVQAVAACRARGGRVVAIGTTALRALESAAAGGALAPTQGETQLFITPGYRFRVVDALLTNFHLPQSTLLMLVSALAGHAHIMALYRHAVAQRYRFFSYGDAMWLTRSGGGDNPPHAGI